MRSGRRRTYLTGMPVRKRTTSVSRKSVVSTCIWLGSPIRMAICLGLPSRRAAGLLCRSARQGRYVRLRSRRACAEASAACAQPGFGRRSPRLSPRPTAGRANLRRPKDIAGTAASAAGGFSPRPPARAASTWRPQLLGGPLLHQVQLALAAPARRSPAATPSPPAARRCSDLRTKLYGLGLVHAGQGDAFSQRRSVPPQ